MVGVEIPHAVVALDWEPVSSSVYCAAADLCCHSPASESGLSWGWHHLLFCCEDGGTVAQVAQEGCGCSNPETSKARLDKALSLQSFNNPECGSEA